MHNLSLTLLKCKIFVTLYIQVRIFSKWCDEMLFSKYQEHGPCFLNTKLKLVTTVTKTEKKFNNWNSAKRMQLELLLMVIKYFILV